MGGVYAAKNDLSAVDCGEIAIGLPEPTREVSLSSSVSSPSQGRRNGGWCLGKTATAVDHPRLDRTRRPHCRFGNKMGTGLAISAQCGYNVRASGQYRNCFAIKAFKYHRNVFSIPRVWQTYRTQNPVCLPSTEVSQIGQVSREVSSS